LIDIPKPDLLHTIQISMLDNLQTWVFHFMNTDKGLDKYNAIWLSVLADHNLTARSKSDQEVFQRDRKEMMELSWYRLPVIT